MRLNLRLVLLVFAVLLGSSLFMSALTYQQFAESIEPAINKKSDAIAQSVESEIVRAMGYGIPLESINGLEEYFDPIVKANPEIYGIRLQRGTFSVDSSEFEEVAKQTEAIQKSYPVVYGDKAVANISLLVDGDYAQKKSLELLLDLLTVIVVSVIIAFELVVFIVGFNISYRIQQIIASINAFIDQQRIKLIEDASKDELGFLSRLLNRRMNEVSKRCNMTIETASASSIQPVNFIRWPFFLLVFSESLSLSFFPIFVGQFYSPDWGLSRAFVVGLPISIFMFIWAVSLPVGGVWSDTVGRRRAFIFGAVLTALGLVLTAFTYTLIDLLVWRSITAIGYGLVFITVQGFVTDNTDQSNRNRGMATFVATFFAGSLSGSAIGGILADHVSMPMIFLLSAILSLAAALFVARFISGSAGSVRPKLSFATIREVCTDRSFLMVTLFSAIPSKIALTGFLYFSAPLFISSLDASKSTGGRVIMLYGLFIICLSSLIAQYADRFKSRLPLIICGGVLGSLAIAIPAIFSSLVGLMVSIALLGMAHAISVPSQLTFITETNQALCARLGLGQVVGIFRLMERAGNILGPIIFGAFISLVGISQAFGWLSLLIGTATLVLSAWVISSRRQRGGA
jgi:MFS family permease